MISGNTKPNFYFVPGRIVSFFNTNSFKKLVSSIKVEKLRQTTILYLYNQIRFFVATTLNFYWNVYMKFTLYFLISTLLFLNLSADEFSQIKKEIKLYGPGFKGYTRLTQETLRKDALILPGDQNPIDVVLRRTSALLKHLNALKPRPELSVEKSELAQLIAIYVDKKSTFQSDKTQRLFFEKVVKLRRSIAFKNPLLNFKDLVFLKHFPQRQGRGEVHMVDQYLGFNQRQGGGVYVLKDAFSDSPKVVDILKDSPVLKGRLKDKMLKDGSFISLDLDYDAKTIAFAFTEADHKVLGPDADWSKQRWQYKESRRKTRNYWQYHFRPESTFHLFKANIDGSGLTQLTDGIYNEYDPCFMPNGRMVFVSERTGGGQRCGTRPLPTATLHSIENDGSDLIPLSWHDTNEWGPSIDNSGKIVYTRWDYIDRDSDIAHHLWFCFPDGTDPRSLHGNYPNSRESRPWMEMSIRAVPNSHKYVAVSAPHHGDNYGSLVLIDQRIEDDRAMSQVKRITPEVLFPESERAPGVPHSRGTHNPRAEVYGTPWPLSEDFYLAVYDTKQRRHGIYLVDSFGNKELLYRDPSISCLDPIPLRPRKRPPVIPSRTRQTKTDILNKAAVKATVSIMNVYEAELPLPKDKVVKELRVVAVFPKWNAFLDEPKIGFANQSLARGILGVVPVEKDGSVYFECPTHIEIYFQLLDDKGQAIQTMRSGTYLHPGEHLTCLGCHENKHITPTLNKRPIALSRPPSILKKEAPGTYPLTFPRLVQPVLDKNCVSCHAKEKKTFPLDSRNFRIEKGIEKKNRYGWSNGYRGLFKYAWGKYGGNGVTGSINKGSYSIPGQIGAKASKLLAILEKGHHGVKLTPQELRRITIWLDCNSVFYGAYINSNEQSKGKAVMPKVHTVKEGLPFHYNPNLGE